MSAGVGNRVSTTSGRRRRAPVPIGVAWSAAEQGHAEVVRIPDPGRDPRGVQRRGVGLAVAGDAAVRDHGYAGGRSLQRRDPAGVLDHDVHGRHQRGHVLDPAEPDQVGPPAHPGQEPGVRAAQHDRCRHPRGRDVPGGLEQPPDPARPTRDQRERAHPRAAPARAVPAPASTGPAPPGRRPWNGGLDDGRRPRAERQCLARREVVDGEVLVDTGVDPEPVDGHVGEVGRDGRLSRPLDLRWPSAWLAKGCVETMASGPVGRDLEQAALGRPQCSADAGGDALVAARRRAAASARSPAPTGPAGGSPSGAPGRGDPASGRRRPRCGCGSLVPGAGPRSRRRRRRGRRRSSRRRCPPARQGLVGRRCCSGCSCRLVLRSARRRRSPGGVGRPSRAQPDRHLIALARNLTTT